MLYFRGQFFDPSTDVLTLASSLAPNQENTCLDMREQLFSNLDKDLLSHNIIIRLMVKSTIFLNPLSSLD